MSDIVRIGIIGAGGIAAKLHLPELAAESSRAKVTLVAGRKESRLKLLCEKFDVPRFVTNYDDVIADDHIDAVIVATPHPSHVEWGVKALTAGKHVYMQKPLSGDLAQADAFVAAADAHAREQTVYCLPHFGDTICTVRKLMRDGPFPTHMEPFESPVENPFNPKLRGNPVARIFPDDVEQLGTSADYPFVATSYRLTEHFHYWTKHNRVNAVLQPEFFVEMSEELAREKGIKHGQRVRIWSKRGEVKGKAVVTKRLKPFKIDGKTVHEVGLPLNFGFIGETKKASPINSLTSAIGDSNSQTPEYKAFLVNIEPIPGPVA